MRSETIITGAEFEKLAANLEPCELIDGEVIPLSPGGYRHNQVTGNIFVILRSHVKTHQLGRVLTNETGMHVSMDPPRCRAADVAYWSYKRLPKDRKPTGFLTVPPDLIVEVFGDDASWPEMESKIADYHRFGVDMVWVADPQTRTVKRFPKDEQPSILHDGQSIDGGAILPDFVTPIAQFFDEEP